MKGLTIALCLLATLATACSVAGAQTRGQTVNELSYVVAPDGMSASAYAYVDNAYPGCERTFTVKLTNDGPESVAVALQFDNIQDLKKGYVGPPTDAADWLTLPAPLSLTSGETQSLPVTIAIPKESKELPKRWEFGLRLARVNATGAVNYEAECTFLVTMR